MAMCSNCSGEYENPDVTTLEVEEEEAYRPAVMIGIVSAIAAFLMGFWTVLFTYAVPWLQRLANF